VRGKKIPKSNHQRMKNKECFRLDMGPMRDPHLVACRILALRVVRGAVRRQFVKRLQGPICGSCRPRLPEQQGGLTLHRTRHLFIRQQTSVINAIRAYLAEFGIVAPVGRRGVEELLNVVTDTNDKRIPDVVRACLIALGSQLLSLKKQILDFDPMIMVWHRSNQTSCTDQACDVKILLANSEPSPHGPRRQLVRCNEMSELRSEPTRKRMPNSVEIGPDSDMSKARLSHLMPGWPRCLGAW
jgi:hypothetical protein